MSAPSWRVETASGSAAVLLQPLPTDHRIVRILSPDDRAVVLGSTQPESHIDLAAAAAAETAILRRRSGGGAVLVGPGLVLWVDVFVPAGDVLWTADVGRAFWWLGEVWAAALVAAGHPDARVWRGKLVRSPWSERICFAGLGAGEVTIGGAKVVGLSQRRTRAGALFQCAVAMVWRPSDYLGLMSLPPPQSLGSEAPARAVSELAAVATGIGPDVAARLLLAFLERLPFSSPLGRPGDCGDEQASLRQPSALEPADGPVGDPGPGDQESDGKGA